MSERRVLNFRVSEELAKEIEQKAKTMGLTVSGYMRFLAKNEMVILREIELLKIQIARLQNTILDTNKMAFRAYRYGWFCAFALRESQIKQVELKVEKELREYEESIKEGNLK